MGVKILNIDCIKYMSSQPDNSFDLAIVDPPYGIGASKMTMGSGSHDFDKTKTWDSCIPSEIYFSELFRVSKNQIIWGGNYFTMHLPPSPHWLLWDKCNPNLSFAEGELAWVNHGKNLRIFKHYSVKIDTIKKIHPTQKPIKLYDWILKNYAEKDQRVLDTHLGSGSSAIAAHYYGVEFVGCELDEDYYNAAKERFTDATRQSALF